MELSEKNYPKFTKGKLEYDPNDINESPSYDYLTSMPIRSMTKKRIEDFMKQRDDKKAMFEILKVQTIYEIWNADLDTLHSIYIKHLNEHDLTLGTTENVKKTISGGGRSKKNK